MAEQAQTTPTNKTALGAAGAARRGRPPAVRAAPPEPQAEPEPEAEEPVAAAPEADEPEPEVRTRKSVEVETRKDQAAKKSPAKVTPTDDYVRDKKGEIRKDEDGDDMRYAAGFHRGAGFVNDAGVRFPPGYKFQGGHIGTFGNVILNRCPKCGHHQPIDAAREGRCENLRAGVNRQPCGFDMVRELEAITLDDI